MTRAEHLAWAKRRALEYVDAGEIVNAVASMTSDLRKHDKLADHPAIPMGTMLLMSHSALHSSGQVRKWIEGFN